MIDSAVYPAQDTATMILKSNNIWKIQDRKLVEKCAVVYKSVCY